MIPSIPKKSSTVILTRDTNDHEFEVLLLRRNDNSRFMGGNYVYPGGKVDAGDSDTEIISPGMNLFPLKSSILFEDLLSVEECLAHRVAAIRELFEESGILIAYRNGGSLYYPEDEDEKLKFIGYRNLLNSGKLNFSEILKREQLTLAFDGLSYFAHWLSPEASAIRFEARFFIAGLPEGQEAIHDDNEITDSIWLTPVKALNENLTGNIFLSPPTLKVLEDVSSYKTSSELFNSSQDIEIKPILPVKVKTDDFHAIVFPWDSEFEQFKSGDIPEPLYHGKLSDIGDYTTRVVLTEGCWLPYNHID